MMVNMIWHVLQKVVKCYFVLLPQLSYIHWLIAFNGQDYKKEKGPGASDQSLFRLLSKFSKVPLLLMYYMAKFNYVYNIKQFLSYSKNYIS